MVTYTARPHTPSGGGGFKAMRKAIGGRDQWRGIPPHSRGRHKRQWR
ncbi:hypothetical protein PG5_34740 [Pseudomonas sp. G5(2012)]|nr:hypothetical protein PG5_34740 [Pseudomonas sp. G5(2012)]